MFLPVLFLADYLSLWRVQKDPPYTTEDSPHTTETRTFAPYLALTVLYLAIDLWINSRNYLVSQGHYTIGFHVFTNALDYVDALYVGRRDPLNYAVIAIGVAVLLIRGNARVRFATCWMLLALAPFLLFNWANTSRYPEYLARFREIHGDIPSNTSVAPDPRLGTTLPYQFVNAAVQWEYGDPTIRLTPYE